MRLFIAAASTLASSVSALLGPQFRPAWPALGLTGLSSLSLAESECAEGFFIDPSLGPLVWLALASSLAFLMARPSRVAGLGRLSLAASSASIRHLRRLPRVGALRVLLSLPGLWSRLGGHSFSSAREAGSTLQRRREQRFSRRRLV